MLTREGIRFYNVKKRNDSLFRKEGYYMPFVTTGEMMKKAQAGNFADEAVSKAIEISGLKVVISECDAEDAPALRDTADKIRDNIAHAARKSKPETAFFTKTFFPAPRRVF